MIAYLSQLDLDFEMVHKRRLRDRYAWHQKTWDLFPGRPDASRDFLTNLEERDFGFRLLVLSQSSPARPSWCPVDCWRSTTVEDEFLASGRKYHFSLVANATKKLVVRDENGVRKKNGTRVPLIRETDLLGWLQRKGSDHGFTFVAGQTSAVSLPQQHFLKNGKHGQHRPARFQGVLEVTDSQLINEAFVNGIGAAKAFGYGMLCLVPRN